MNRNNNENNLIKSDQNEKAKYFKEVTITFTSLTMILLLYLIFGQSFMVEFTLEDESYVVINNNNFVTMLISIVSFLPIFWVILSFCIILFYLTIVLHKQINFIFKWAFFFIQIVLNSFIVVGISNYLAYNKQFIDYQYYYYIEIYNSSSYLLLKNYFMEIAFCMFCGLGIGLQSYSQMNKQDIDFEKAFLIGIICPFFIFISQMYYVSVSEQSSSFICYLFVLLIVFVLYLGWILFELHQQMYSDKIDFDTKEYYLGAMIIFQPIKTIIIRVISIFI